MPQREADSLLLMGCPLAASTPTTTTRNTTTPTVYAHYNPEQTSQPPPPPVPLPVAAQNPLPPPSYVPLQDVSSVTLPRSYPREHFSPGGIVMPYSHDLTSNNVTCLDIASDMTSSPPLLPPYSHMTLTLGRNGSFSSGRATPSSANTSSSVIPGTSTTSTVALVPEGESPRGNHVPAGDKIPLASTQRENPSSPSPRESSV